MSVRFACSFAACLLIAAPVSAETHLQAENLLILVPKGFMVGNRGTRPDLKLEVSEYVPTGETVESWSKMITQQTFFGRRNVDPDLLPGSMRNGWKSACPGGDAQQIKKLQENGYAVSLWMFTCPMNPKTGKPENMWLKAISGADSLYDVQIAFRAPLEKETIPSAMNYLKNVMVCDTRDRTHPCPAGM